ncbi:MAG TPA: hypothetical protein VGQ76_19305 [Thermoanaerobaculia bacterium]|nr:hypothetical protein [Thermoanaerobaculia bacterium]
MKDFLTTASAYVDQSTLKDSGTALTLGYNLRQRVNLEVTLADPALSPLWFRSGQ